MRPKTWLRAALAVTITAAAGPPVFAQKAPSKKKSTTPWQDCGHGVSAHLSMPIAAQGVLLEVELLSAAPLAHLKADWDGHELPFWQDSAGKNHQRALLGVDLEHESGNNNLELSAQLPANETFACSLNVRVNLGKFPVEKLTVEKKFVEPNPEEVARANHERQHLKEIFATVTPNRLWTGSFRLPLDGTRSAKNFGRRRVLNGVPGSLHSGVDFPALAGTPVHAAQRGRVVLAEGLFFSGNTVVIDHGLGVYTFYGHMRSTSAVPGDIVEKGSLLGEVGATGRVTGPHLHWGLTVNQARVNPLQILSLPLS